MIRSTRRFSSSPHGLQFSPQAFAELPQGFFVLPGQEDFPREEAVLECIEADGGLALRRLGPGAL